MKVSIRNTDTNEMSEDIASDCETLEDYVNTRYGSAPVPEHIHLTEMGESPEQLSLKEGEDSHASDQPAQADGDGQEGQQPDAVSDSEI